MKQLPDREWTDEQLEAWIAQVEEHEMLHAPAHLKQEILKNTGRVDVQMVVKTQDWSKSMQLFFYSLKIGAAAAAALFLLFWMPSDLNIRAVIPEAAVETQQEEEPQMGKISELNREIHEKTAQINRKLYAVNRDLME